MNPNLVLLELRKSTKNFNQSKTLSQQLPCQDVNHTHNHRYKKIIYSQKEKSWDKLSINSLL